MTDNGSGYRAKVFRKGCSDLGLRHISTSPYTPKTNGKAERFIQSALREWAYAHAFPSIENSRAEDLPVWLKRYNWNRKNGVSGRAEDIAFSDCSVLIFVFAMERGRESHFALMAGGSTAAVASALPAAGEWERDFTT